MPKILFFDIEVAPTTAYVWKLYDTNVVGVERQWYVLSIAWKWGHEHTTHVKGLCDYKNYKKDMEDDSAILADFHKEINAADIVIGHNGDAFDIKKIKARMLVHGFGPLRPFKTVDTLKIARRE